MIVINKKEDCCGCSACVQICPKRCISFEEDEEGFRYPVADKSRCIECGCCEKVCPCINKNKEEEPIKIFAAINRDEEIRLDSSSGGIFSLIANAVINENGIVFGARFDKNWEVIHDYVDTIDKLTVFRGSKYLQSIIGDTYKLTKEFLKQGRKVLFSGTPCQIAGLKKFLQKDYDNLITIDFICHGVPSPKVWRKYLESINENRNRNNTDSSISHISFRDKTKGWKNYGITIRDDMYSHFESFSDNPYMKAFLNNMILRESCHTCPTKSGKSQSDITLADFWGIEKECPEMDDDKGTSLVIINSTKGCMLWNKLDTFSKEINLESISTLNSSWSESAPKSEMRSLFFSKYQQHIDKFGSITFRVGSGIHYPHL